MLSKKRLFTNSTPLPADASNDENPATPGNRRKRLVLLVAVPLIAILGVAIIYLIGGRYVSTENAYVKADMVPVGASVSGTVLQVPVRQNQFVQAGDVLVELDETAFQLAVRRAEAKLAQVRTELVALKAGYREKQTEAELARTQHAFALKEQQRQANLLKQHLVAPSDYDEAKQRTDLAALQVTATEQDLKRIAESLGGNADAPVEQHPNYREALAALEQARLDLQHATLRAPLDGVVSHVPEPGQYIAAGTAAMTLVASGHSWVIANFTETELTHVHPGQTATVQVDMYPGTTWHGVVESMSPATEAEFSVIPAQNASGNWVKVTQRLPVRIRLQNTSGLPQLRAGLSAVVEIDTEHRRRLLGFTF
jgi:membrane fusion protein (multidrug efflux system)